jgi:hypothetical protein
MWHLEHPSDVARSEMEAPCATLPLIRASSNRAPALGSSKGSSHRAYQHAFSGRSGGLVFTNSVHRIGKFVPGKSGLIWDLSEDEIRSAYPLPPSVTKGPAPTRTTEPFDRLPPALQATRLWFDRRRWETWDRTKVGPQADLSWRMARGVLAVRTQIPLARVSERP